jgi:hypothetical protein
VFFKIEDLIHHAPFNFYNSLNQEDESFFYTQGCLFKNFISYSVVFKSSRGQEVLF